MNFTKVTNFNQKTVKKSISHNHHFTIQSVGMHVHVSIESKENAQLKQQVCERDIYKQRKIGEFFLVERKMKLVLLSKCLSITQFYCRFIYNLST